MRTLPLLVLLTACGGYGSAFHASTTLAEVTCERAYTCRTAFPEDAEEGFDTLYGPTQEACVEALGPDPGRKDAWDDAEDAGRLGYDRDAAGACADALEATACDGFWPVRGGEACAAVLTGTIEAESPCALDAECVSGACVEGECL